MLYFTNPGKLDIRLASVFGAHVKLNENPIGFFGTGLKIAIAVILRHKGKIHIHSGQEVYTYSVQADTIRGKEFEFVYMNEQQMPFTLDLGKTWEPWMAYRELYSNARDEGGTVSTEWSDSIIAACGHDYTAIIVDCPEVEQAHRERDEFLLSGFPEHVVQYVELLTTPSAKLYYHGIKVGTLSHPGHYTYNYTAALDLTEDRTVKSLWMVERNLIRLLMASPPEVFEPVLFDKDCWEWAMDWTDICYPSPPAPFLDHINKYDHAQRRQLPISLVSLLDRVAVPPEIELTKVEMRMVEKALLFCKRIGHNITEQIIPVENLGEGIYGTVRDGKIVIAKLAFQMGTKQVATTLLEEHLHITKALVDETYGMQNYLFNLIIGLGEELAGEPL
jgi:hypothetical protein